MQSCVQTGVIYCFNQLTTSMKQSLYALKAAILFCPFKVQQMKSTISAVDSLSVFPFCLHKFLHSKRGFLLTWMFLKIVIPAMTHWVSGSSRNSFYPHGVRQQGRLS